MPIVASLFEELLRIMLENTTQSMVSAATLITNFVTVQRQQSPVTQTLKKELKKPWNGRHLNCAKCKLVHERSSYG